MRRVLRSLVLLAVLVGVIAGPVHTASARSEKTLAYQRDEVWATAVRFLVVDEHVKVLEKDGEAGYVLFELKDEGKSYKGSLEVMTVVRDKHTSVRFVLQIEDRPSWVEIAMLTRLERKLHAELGSPAPPPAKDPPREPPAKDAPAKDAPKAAPRPDEGGPPISPTP